MGPRLPWLAVLVAALAACTWEDLPCEDDVNCPHQQVCCDGGCIDPAELQAEEGEGEGDGEGEGEGEDNGCFPR